MFGWILGMVFGCWHKWRWKKSEFGQYAYTKEPFIINVMKCERCGIEKPIIKGSWT